MSATPEAIRLAAWLRDGAWHQMRLGDVEAAGRELIRLHSANQDLLEALMELNARLLRCSAIGISSAEAYDSFYQCIAQEAIAKATGETP